MPDPHNYPLGSPREWLNHRTPEEAASLGSPGEVRADFADALGGLIHTLTAAQPQLQAGLSSVARKLALAMNRGQTAVSMQALTPAERSALHAACAQQFLVAQLEQHEAVPPQTLFVCTERLVYFARSAEAEAAIAQNVLRLAAVVRSALQLHEKRALQAIAATLKLSEEQRAAVECAVLHSFAIITGGPGTGKTSCLAAVLAFKLGHTQVSDEPERIALAAPTGKAAQRMREAISSSVGVLRSAGLWQSEWEARLPEPLTVHRLLGARAFDGLRAPTLDFSSIVIDEASMLDQELASALCRALPARCSLLLLGDAAQLSAVEQGASFASLCAARGMERFRASLTRSYRFDAAALLGRICAKVRAGDAQALEELLAHNDESFEMLEPRADSLAKLKAGYAPFAAQLKAGAPARQLLQALTRYCVLCARRAGPWGTYALNREIAGGLGAAAAQFGGWYHGMPVMVLRNDPGTALSNGQTGLVLQCTEGFVAYFESAKEASGVREIPVSRLPEVELAYATTVHKAQGSEYERLALVLGEDDSVSRALVYTGLTRAKQGVLLVARSALVQKAVNKEQLIVDGLEARLGFESN